MRKIIRFADLVAGGVVTNRPQLRNLQELHDFPTGFLIGANQRGFYEDEVEAWIKKRVAATKTAKATPRGFVADPRKRHRAKEARQ